MTFLFLQARLFMILVLFRLRQLAEQRGGSMLKVARVFVIGALGAHLILVVLGPENHC